MDAAQLAQVTDLNWIRQHLNVLIIGPTGVGKSYVAAALAHSACRADFAVRCFRMPRLVEELARYGAMQKRSALLRQLAKADLLVLDDFRLAPLADETVRDLLEILDDRYDRRSTLITIQLPSISGMAIWEIARSPMPSSTGLYTTAIAWCSRASPCGGTRA